jgi:hypothetical protein
MTLRKRIGTRAATAALRGRRSDWNKIERLESRLLMSTNSWQSAVSGDWDDASKWSAGHVPTAAEDVAISVAGSYTITHSSFGADQAKSLKISAGTLELDAGSLTVNGGATQVTGSGTLTFNGGTLAKSTLSTSGGGHITMLSGGGSLDGVTLACDFPATSALGLFHTTTIDAGKKIAVSDASVYLDDSPTGGASLVGSGQVVLGGTTGGNLYLFNSYGHNATIASTGKVHGYGNIYIYGATNHGTISADQNGKTLTVTGSTWTNKGTLSAVNGGILTTAGTWTSPSPGKLTENASTLILGGTFSSIGLPARTGGTITVTGVYNLGGGTLALTATTGSWNLQAGTIKHGTLSTTGGAQLVPIGSGALDTIKFATNFTVPAGTSLYLYHACTLASGVKLTSTDSTLELYDQLDGGASLGGTGEVVLNGSNGGDFYLYNGHGHPATIGNGVHVHGYGWVYSNGSDTNNGVIDSDAGRNLIVAGNLTNKGLIRASHGNVQVTTSAGFVNQGAIAAEGGRILFNGPFNCGNGTIDIGIGGTAQGTSYGLISVSGALTLGGTINTYLVNGFHPANGAVFTPIGYFSKTGSFATSHFNAGGGVAFTPTFGPTFLSIKASTSASSVASVSGGKLTLNGTAGNDTLLVTDALGVIVASRNGVTSVFSDVGVTGIDVNGGDGNDIITYTGSTIPSTLSGGNGNDTITGSKAADSILGGAGNDTFFVKDGTSNKDSVDGGAGTDVVKSKDPVDVILNVP